MMSQLNKIFIDINCALNFSEERKGMLLLKINTWRQGLLAKAAVSAENQFAVMVEELRQNKIYVTDEVLTNLRRLEEYAETLSNLEIKDEAVRRNILNLQISVHKLMLAAEALMVNEDEAYAAAMTRLQDMLSNPNANHNLRLKGRLVKEKIREVKEQLPSLRAILIEVTTRTGIAILHPEDTNNLQAYADLSEIINRQSSHASGLVGAMVLLAGAALIVGSVLLLFSTFGLNVLSYVGISLGGVALLTGLGLLGWRKPIHPLGENMADLAHTAYRHQI